MQEPKYNMCHDDLPRVLERLRELTDEYGHIMTVAEVGAPEPLPVMKEYTHGARRLNTAYSFDFLSSPEVTPDLVRRVLQGWPGEEFEGWPSWAFSNHDAPRVVSRWLQGAGEQRRAKLLALLQFSLRGNVFLYQGEELGLPQAHVPFDKLQDPEGILNWPETMGRDGARTPMPWTDAAPNAGFSTSEAWLPVDARHLPLAVAGQDADSDSTLNFFRRALRIRQAHAALRVGDIRFLQTPEGLLAFERIRGEAVLLCVFNLSPAPIEAGELDVGEVIIALHAEKTAARTQIAPFSGYIAHSGRRSQG
jgi:alpha-glucosidase